MKLTKKQMRKGFTLVELLVVIAIIAVLAGLATPAILKAKKSADKAKTVSNAKQIGIAMMDFDGTYGEFPSDGTRKELESIGEEVPSGDSANDYFAQLLINDSVDSEKIFYAKGVRGVKEGDNVFKNQPDKILEKSENGFGYFMYDDKTALSSSDASSCPLVCAPLKSGGPNPVFDENAYAGEYVYLQLDSSVVTGKIKDGRALLKNQGMKTITTTGEGSMWETAQPVVMPPAAIQ
ncbi:MAG: prepilin-type N-terminal cleavage/methylation domain-containing protein [Akkermansiaceae bacterium]|nr:prepilin-type N-terminal cleavage/methylation domain-containing protein [Akkermansiaceae bacterium]